MQQVGEGAELGMSRGVSKMKALHKLPKTNPTEMVKEEVCLSKYTE